MTESELTLVAPGARGADILLELATVHELAGFMVEAPQRRDIRDVYWDTPVSELGRHGYALRIREQNGSCLLALKGNSTVEADGLVHRLEIEGRADAATLERIVEALHGAGITLSVEAGQADDPEYCFRRAGLAAIQNRRTHRIARNISMDPPGHDSLELALDTVYYQVQEAQLVHREIELEGQGARGIHAARSVAEFLQVHYGDSLRVWRHNKLVSGMALLALQGSGLCPGSGAVDIDAACYESVNTFLQKGDSVLFATE